MPNQTYSQSPRRIVSAAQEPMFSIGTRQVIALGDVHLFMRFEDGKEKPEAIVILSERQENLQAGYLPVEAAAPATIGILLHTANEEWIQLRQERGGRAHLPEEHKLQPQDLRVFLHTPENSRIGVLQDRWDEQRYVWTEGPKSVIREQGDRPAIPVDPAVVCEAIGVENFDHVRETTRQPRLAPQRLQQQPEWDLDL